MILKYHSLSHGERRPQKLTISEPLCVQLCKQSKQFQLSATTVIRSTHQCGAVRAHDSLKVLGGDIRRRRACLARASYRSLKNPLSPRHHVKRSESGDSMPERRVPRHFPCLCLTRCDQKHIHMCICSCARVAALVMPQRAHLRNLLHGVSSKNLEINHHLSPFSQWCGRQFSSKCARKHEVEPSRPLAPFTHSHRVFES